MDRETKLDIIEMGRGYLGAILLAILMYTGAVSAMAVFPGETIIVTNEMGVENLIYTITHNSTPVNNLEVNINQTNITISLPEDMIPDSFDIVFLENNTHEVIKTIRIGGGGSSKTKYVDRNITVKQPLFYDRNITTIKEIELKGNDTIIYKYTDNNKNWWMIFFGMLIGIIILYSSLYIYYNFIKTEDDIGQCPTVEEIIRHMEYEKK